MKTTSRCNEYRLGRLGRRRSYGCRSCGKTFRADFRFTPLSERERICPDCFQKGNGTAANDAVPQEIKEPDAECNTSLKENQ